MLWLVIPAALSLAVGYAIVEPFRLIRFADPTFEARSVGALIDAARTAGSIGREVATAAPDEVAGSPSEVLARAQTVADGVLALEYRERVAPNAAEPMRISAFFLAPLYAWVPRFLWPSKPIVQVGLWFSQTVRLLPSEVNAVGAGPIAYLYLVGGWTAILLAMVSLGVFGQVIFEAASAFGLRGQLVLLGVGPAFALFDTAVDTIFVSALRILPVLLVVQWILLAPRTRMPSGGGQFVTPTT